MNFRMHDWKQVSSSTILESEVVLCNLKKEFFFPYDFLI